MRRPDNGALLFVRPARDICISLAKQIQTSERKRLKAASVQARAQFQRVRRLNRSTPWGFFFLGRKTPRPAVLNPNGRRLGSRQAASGSQTASIAAAVCGRAGADPPGCPGVVLDGCFLNERPPPRACVCKENPTKGMRPRPRKAPLRGGCDERLTDFLGNNFTLGCGIGPA